MAIESWNKPSSQPNEETVAEKYTGATNKIFRGEQHPPFGIGTMGAVAQEKITVLHGDKTKELEVVMKSFKYPSGDDGLESSVAAFRLLKEAGVKHIPTTYRQVGASEVLMTDYNHDDNVAVGGNDNEKASALHVDSITNFSGLLASMGEDIRKASDAGIDIYTDCYFFIIPKSGGEVQVDFVIGDLGGIGKAKEDARPDLYLNNVTRAEYALLSLVSLHIKEEKRDEYERVIREWVTPLKNDGK